MWIKKKISGILDSRKSDDYQRVLSSIRVYASILWQNKTYSNILLVFFTMFLLAAIVPIISIYYLKNDLNLPYYVYYVAINLLMLLMVLILGIWNDHQFKIFKSIKIIVFNKFNLSFVSFAILIMILSLISNPISILEASYLLIITPIYCYFILILLGIADFLDVKSIIDFSIQQLKETDNKNKKILSRYQLYYYSIFLYYNKIYKNLCGTFKENLTKIMGLQYIFLLTSEIFYNDKQHRQKLLEILNRLKETKPIENNKEFLEIIKDIRKNFNERYIDIYGKEPDANIFIYRSRFNQIKSFLLILFPFITITVTIIQFILSI